MVLYRLVIWFVGGNSTFAVILVNFMKRSSLLTRSLDVGTFVCISLLANHFELSTEIVLLKNHFSEEHERIFFPEFSIFGSRVKGEPMYVYILVNV